MLYEMLADTKDNLIRHLPAKLLKTPGGWSTTKDRMREHLEHLTQTHQYEGAWLDYGEYQLTRVGKSFQHDAPLGRRSFLRHFAGHRVQLVRTDKGQFRKWVRGDVISNIALLRLGFSLGVTELRIN